MLPQLDFRVMLLASCPSNGELDLVVDTEMERLYALDVDSTQSVRGAVLAVFRRVFQRSFRTRVSVWVARKS